MAYEALRHYSQRDLTFRFVSNIDGTDFAEATRDLDAAETLFIISSKTFTTLETMTNARTAATGLHDVKSSRCCCQAFSSRSRAMSGQWRRFGIDTANMFEFWDWVAGATRWTPAIGLSTMIASAPNISARCSAASIRWTSNFRTPLRAQLAGSHGAPGLWYNNFFGAQTVAVLPYEQYLKRFPAYSSS